MRPASSYTTASSSSNTYMSDVANNKRPVYNNSESIEDLYTCTVAPNRAKGAETCCGRCREVNLLRIQFACCSQRASQWWAHRVSMTTFLHFVTLLQKPRRWLRP